MKTLSRIFIILGLSFYAIGIYNIWLRIDPNRLSFQNYHSKSDASVNSNDLPQRVIIKNLNINLPVIPAKVTNNVWETTNDGASYLKSSPIPGSNGNSVIYAHNWTNLFGNLTNAKPGETIEIEFKDKSRKTFEIEYTSIVLANQSSILSPSKDKRITLYTCTGFLDSKRFVVVGILKENTTASSSKDLQGS